MRLRTRTGTRITATSRTRRGLAGLTAAAGIAASVLALTPDAATAAGGSANAPGQIKKVCAAPGPGQASCHALQRTGVQEPAGLAANGHGPTSPNATPAGYGAADIESAYKLPTATASTSVTGGTVAIVDAYDDPTAEADLATYRMQNGLPACTSGNGCFTKVNQTGGSTMPAVDSGWAQEISLDLDMVSAACPSCRILLLEATSSSFADLGTAVTTAAHTAGVVAISNSYGGSDASDSSYGKYYNWPGKAVTVSSGDNGYGAEYPASSQFVVAVGGTSLSHSTNARGWSESAWSGAGSGCSRYNTKPSWQTTATACGTRALADVSAVADPNTGVAVYDSTPHNGSSGWLVFGGTSASSPIVASVYALAGYSGNGTSAAATVWGNTGSLNDVTSGSNGHCRTKVWCNAGSGWDGPTGLGTPNGTAAFK